MTPEEIVAEISTTNRNILYIRKDYQSLTPEQVLALMDAAAMRGFRFGSNVALSMLQGELLVRLTRMARPGPGASDNGAARRL